MVQSLYSIHRTFLSLPGHQATATGFIALVTGYRNVSDESTSHGGVDQTVRTSGKARKRGDATKHKANEGANQHHSCHERTTSGFSSSFKTIYYGDANKAEQGQTFLDSKGAGDAEIYQSQHLKKRKVRRIMDEEVQTGKVEHEPMMAAKEGIKFDDSLYQQETPNDFISEDDMLVLDVLQSLVNAPSKTSKLKINIPPGSLGKPYSTLSHGLEEGHSPIDLLRQAKPAGECSPPKTRQRKHNKILDAEVPDKEHNISVVNLVQPEAHTVGIVEVSFLCSDSKEVMPETSVSSSAEVDLVAPAETNPRIKMSRRTKRKVEMHCKTKYVPCKVIEGSDNLQARKFHHCLSSESLHRWCTYEWFYSAVEYPWFSNNEFVSYLNHANLCHIPRLTRSEWSMVRSSLGKPRRFSDQLLAMEKEKLEDYRKKVRKIYAQLSDGLRDSLPADLARPFSIGQQVIVRHPHSRELCDGKVVMMGWDFYKVQFSNTDLGVDIVKDTDCMPFNWSDNRPDDMRSYLSNNALIVLEMKHIPDLEPSENLYHTTNGVSVPEQPKSLHLELDEQLKFTVNSEMPPNRRISDGSVLSRGDPDNKFGNSDDLESYVTSFVQRSLSQARQIVDEAMLANSDDEEVCTSNQTTDCIVRESEAAVHDTRCPSNLISNCIATVISIKSLSDSRHPPANIAGVLERASSMLRPSCPENLAVYKDIESYLSIIANQILALVPTTLGSGPALSM